MTVAIRVENLSKKYIIDHQKKERYETLADKMDHIGRSIIQRISHPLSVNSEKIEQEEFWAIQDINFEVQQGDRLGIIGRNGAGKSTLLKVLSRITEPATGKVTINGRVASLLEVGTGFHPELTGRENIFLNGAILGMRKTEIKNKFDEIVDFAEVEKFLDTPVKRYSSGMHVRLAFAVAAHLDPEILIVDEVLAVGDALFQKKCLGKMKEAGKEGRTILFVSHNMGVISQLCTNCIWLDEGKIKEKGETGLITNAYMLNEVAELSGEVVFPENPNKHAQLIKVSMVNHEGNVSQKYDCDKPIHIKFDIVVKKQIPGLYGYIGINKPDGTNILVSDSFDATMKNPLDSLPVGINTFLVTVPPRTLGHGDYELLFSFASQMADKFHVDEPGTVCSFSLDDFTSKRGNLRAGFFSTLMPWQKIECR
ncbi:MAG: ATP-binding cassette domain-containing protein [Endozoicomonadaceae bacterium]|nr:ATP-binding cassette domain-containing protein [Endozoicomonadaceae bacterium]